MAEAGALPAFVPDGKGGGAYYSRSRFRPDTILVANITRVADAEPVPAEPAPTTPVGAVAVAGAQLSELNTAPGTIVTVPAAGGVL